MSETEPLTERQRYWLKHIRASQENQQSLKAYARQHRLNIQSLYGAKKQLKRKGVLGPDRPRRFVRVTTPLTMPSTASCRVLLANGAVVELTCAAEEAEWVLQAVSRLP